MNKRTFSAGAADRNLHRFGSLEFSNKTFLSCRNGFTRPPIGPCGKSLVSVELTARAPHVAGVG
jgi:hypothetical protein